MNANRNYQDYLDRKRRDHGARFDTSNLDPRFVQFFESGQRIKVRTFGMEITGTVSATTGWKPSFLLMRTSRSMSSPWILGRETEIIAVQKGRVYASVPR